MKQKLVKELEQYYLPTSTLSTKASLLCNVTSDIILSFLYHLKQEKLCVAKTVVSCFSEVLLILSYLFLPLLSTLNKINSFRLGSVATNIF